MPNEKSFRQHKSDADLEIPRIAFDLMGNENDPAELIDAIRSIELEHPLHCTLIAHRSLESILKKITSSTINYALSDEVIEMDDHPLTSIREKPNSSLCLGMSLLKQNKIDAFVSAGNTGALMASAKKYLSTLPNILRPGLIALLPTRKSQLAILDVGANVQCKSEHLVQFAEMGIAFQRTRGIDKPRVGLLNIGAEALKGTSELRLAYQQLTVHKEILFQGNIEGKEIFNGNVDVLVTDGFTGNIMLKTSEGLASFILDRLEENIPAKDKLQDLKGHLHYAEYPGALLSGVNGIVIKCHGYSSPHAIMNGIQGAAQMVRQKFLSHLSFALKK